MPVPSRQLLVWTAVAAAAALGIIAFPAAWLALLAFDFTVAGAALLDWLITPGPDALDAVRFAPERMSVLSEHRIVIVVQNKSGVPLRVRLRDTPPAVFQVKAEELAGRLNAYGEVRWEYGVTPKTRGRFEWGPMHLRYRSLLGFWERQKQVEAFAGTNVFPNLAALHRYHLLARANRLDTIGIRKIRSRGGAWEFESLRDYVYGDDIRLMDWKATARRVKPIVRNHQAERNQTILLLVDCGRLMNAEVAGVAKLDQAVNTALMLSHVALARGDRVGLCTFSHKVHSWLPPRGHLSQNRFITEALFDLRGDYTETDHGGCLRLLALRHPKRALLVVLTDFVDAETASEMIAHLHLAARRHVVLFAALKDPFLEQAARLRPAASVVGFRKAAAVELLRERREVLERIRQMGGHVLDVQPSELTPPLINRYLEITHRGLL